MTNEAPKTPLGEKLLAIRNRAIANGMQLKTEEEIMTNEAPTKKSPKFHEKSGEYCYKQVEDFDQTYGMMCPIDYQELTDYARKLEAHIAALKTELSEEIRIGDARAEREGKLRDKVSKLEAENKRLTAELDFTAHRMKHEADERDKADDQNKRLVDAIKGVIRVADRKTVEFDEAKSALAQTGEKS